MTQIVKPIVILGTGRCGSTVLHHLMAAHPRVMWLSNLCQRFPTKPAWNRRMVTAMGNPLVRRVAGERILPSEAYRFWDRYAYGFSTPFRDLVREDVTPRIKKQVRSVIENMLTERRNRLLVKIAGWSRIGFLDEIFEDAKFIHIVRDGRSVTSSLLHVDFWPGWKGPQGWGAGMLSPEDQATWERYGRSFVALAALQWRLRTRAIEAARRQLDPSRYLEVRYEEFCERPLDVIQGILDFGELPRSASFEEHVKRTPIRDSNRWRDDLTARQQQILEELLHEDLVRHGYSVAG
jgi:omega-hydroxy-beta-dihydromenaquinone-9 sulfotransferase